MRGEAYVFWSGFCEFPAGTRLDGEFNVCRLDPSGAVRVVCVGLGVFQYVRGVPCASVI